MDSWWNSVEIISKYNFILQILSMSFLFLSLTAGAISLKFSKRLSDLRKLKETAAQEIDSLRTQEIEKLQNELINTKNELKDTKNELNNRLEKTESAVKVTPLPERLYKLLTSIDTKIMPSLKAGHTNFEGGITATQFVDLQDLAKEPGANKYITISSDVKMGIGMGQEGVTYGVKFTLTPQLLKDIKR